MGGPAGRWEAAGVHTAGGAQVGVAALRAEAEAVASPHGEGVRLPVDEARHLV